MSTTGLLFNGLVIDLQEKNALIIIGSAVGLSKNIFGITIWGYRMLSFDSIHLHAGRTSQEKNKKAKALRVLHFHTNPKRRLRQANVEKLTSVHESAKHVSLSDTSR